MDSSDKNLQLFLYVISSFEMAAMQGMGKISNPVDGKISRNLEHAQFAIDVLDMIKDKTKGNLTEYEQRFLETVSSQLKLNFVDESSKKTDVTSEEETSKEEKSEDK